jgi:hypothetical protein
MDTVRLRPLCYALGFNATRPEQWISRGYFKPSEAGVPGRARELTKDDALKLLVLVELVDAGIDAAAIHRDIRFLHRFRGERAFLVISRGEIGLIIPATERGSPAPTDDECTRVSLPPGHYRSDVVSESDLLRVITDPHKSVSFVVNLNRLYERVNAAFEEIAAKEAADA